MWLVNADVVDAGFNGAGVVILTIGGCFAAIGFGREDTSAGVCAHIGGARLVVVTRVVVVALYGGGGGGGRRRRRGRGRHGGS